MMRTQPVLSYCFCPPPTMFSDGDIELSFICLCVHPSGLNNICLSIHAPPASGILKSFCPNDVILWRLMMAWRHAVIIISCPYVKQFSRESAELQTHPQPDRTNFITPTAEAGGKNVMVGIEWYVYMPKSSSGPYCHQKHFPSSTLFKGGGYLELRAHIFINIGFLFLVFSDIFSWMMNGSRMFLLYLLCDSWEVRQRFIF